MAYYKAGSLYFAQNSNVVVDNASGDIANFNTQLCLPLLETKLGFSAKQDLHGYDSPWMDSTVLDKKPYLLQPISGTASRYGNYLYDKIVGGTVAFNQLVKNGNFEDSSYWNSSSANFTIADNKISFIATNSRGGIYQAVNLIENHVYISKIHTKSTTSTNKIRFCINRQVAPYDVSEMYSQSSTNWQELYIIKKPSNSSLYQLRVLDMRISDFDAVDVKNFTCIDLTQMFGSTIADYIYSLEQATAGAGVAFFRSLFPEDYYSYNTGELMSVKTTAHVIKNASNTVIGNYPLDSDLELRGIPKLDANNNLYYDGDIYESSGKVTRKYFVYTVTGDETFIVASDMYIKSDACDAFFENNTILRLSPNTDQTLYARCNRLNIVKQADAPQGIWGTTGVPNTFQLNSNQVHLNIANSLLGITDYTQETRDTVKAKIKAYVKSLYDNGTPLVLVLPLLESTTETADAFTNPQVSDQYGTEEYVDSRTIHIPVGHETYQANICPIEGVSEVNYAHSGVNLWDEEWELGNIGTSGGGNTPSTTRIRSVNYIPVKKNAVLYIKSSFGINLFFYDKNKNFITYSGLLQNQSFDLSMIISGDVCFIRFRSETGVTSNNKDVSINYPSTDTDYHSHSSLSSTALIQFGDTYYGGEVIIDKDGKRKIKVTCVYLSDMSSLGWQYQSNFNRFITNELNSVIKRPADNNEVLAGLKCPLYGTNSSNQTAGTTYDNIIGCSSSGNVSLKDTSLDGDLTALSERLANQILVYPLAEPIIIDLPDGAVIKSIPSVNNMFCDTGNTSVRFRKIGE